MTDDDFGGKLVARKGTLSEGSGKAKGGFARAESLTPERRSEIAQKAAQTRWEKPRKPSVAKERKDRLNVEVLAVAIFESACRGWSSRASSELTMIFIWTKTPAWTDLTKEDRNSWRQKARAMLAEQ